MELGLEGRVALVMGASGGIGLGIADALAREGAKAAIVSRSRERLDDARAQHPQIAAAFVADTGDLDALGGLVADVERELGPVEILVTNTGGPPAGPSLAHSIDDWRASYDELVLAPRVLIEAVLPAMTERGWGRIINVGSVSTREPITGLTLSNVHRAATVGFFKTLADEVAGKGVTVNTVATGRFATERMIQLYGSLETAKQQAETTIPAGRMGETAEYGDFVAFLASERAGFITGTVMPLDGGALRSV